MSVTCDESARGMKRATGWVFAHLFNHYFGDGTVVLVGEESDDRDLEFTATDRWLEANHCQNFGITPEVGQDMQQHVEKCSCQTCCEVKERLSALEPLVSSGLPSEVAVVSVFQSKALGSRTPLSRRNGFGDAIDQLAPLFRWFVKDRDFWIWPA